MSAVRHVQIEHRGQTLNVDYRPARVGDPDMQRDIEKAVATNDIELHARILARTVVAWDVVRGETPVAITEDAILDLPYELMALIRAEIGRDFAVALGWEGPYL